MRRSLDDAFFALRELVRAWQEHRAEPGVHIFVYAPEHEAPALARFPAFAEECADTGLPVELVDVGQGMLAFMERRTLQLDALGGLERSAPRQAQHDLGMLAERYLLAQLAQPPTAPALCRIFVNTGALGTVVSYSAITNGLPADAAAVRAVIAFPGEDDEKSLNLLGLRADMNYRVPRI